MRWPAALSHLPCGMLYSHAPRACAATLARLYQRPTLRHALLAIRSPREAARNSEACAVRGSARGGPSGGLTPAAAHRVGRLLLRHGGIRRPRGCRCALLSSPRAAPGHGGGAAAFCGGCRLQMRADACMGVHGGWHRRRAHETRELPHGATRQGAGAPVQRHGGAKGTCALLLASKGGRHLATLCASGGSGMRRPAALCLRHGGAARSAAGGGAAARAR
jgi:hypothetical protein